MPLAALPLQGRVEAPVLLRHASAAVPSGYPAYVFDRPPVALAHGWQGYHSTHRAVDFRMCSKRLCSATVAGMLDADVRFEGFDSEDWTRLVELMRTRSGSEAEPGLLLVHDGTRVVKVLRTVGQAQTRPSDPWRPALDQLARNERVGWVVALDSGALEAWMSAIGARVGREHDAIDQLLIAWDEARRLALEGRLETWPASAGTLPVPSKNVVLAGLSLVCPPRESLLVAVWDRETLWTSVALRRSERGFDRIIGPDGMRADVEAVGPKPDVMWRRLISLVESRCGPVGLGIGADRSTWTQVMGASEAGSWAKAVATGKVKVEPLARGLALPLAVDVSRAALGVLRTAVGRASGPREEARGGGTLQDIARLWQIAQGLLSLQRRGRQR